MANSPLVQATAAPLNQLTKPAEWQNFMVDAAIALAGPGLRLPDTLEEWKRNAEEAKMAIFDILTALEFSSIYAWPDFKTMGFDFANTMRLRRALVTDVTVALMKSDTLRNALKQHHFPPSSAQFPTPQSSRTGGATVTHSRFTQTSPAPTRDTSEVPESESGSESETEAEIVCPRCENDPQQWEAIEKNSSTYEHLLDLFGLKKWDGMSNARDTQAFAGSIYRVVKDKVQTELTKPEIKTSRSTPSAIRETHTVDGDVDANEKALLKVTRADAVGSSSLKRRFESPPPSSQVGARRRV